MPALLNSRSSRLPTAGGIPPRGSGRPARRLQVAVARQVPGERRELDDEEGAEGDLVALDAVAAGGEVVGNRSINAPVAYWAPKAARKMRVHRGVGATETKRCAIIGTRARDRPGSRPGRSSPNTVQIKRLAPVHCSTSAQLSKQDEETEHPRSGRPRDGPAGRRPRRSAECRSGSRSRSPSGSWQPRSGRGRRRRAARVRPKGLLRCRCLRSSLAAGPAAPEQRSRPIWIRPAIWSLKRSLGAASARSRHDHPK